jgi:hypothetical protein
VTEGKERVVIDVIVRIRFVWSMAQGGVMATAAAVVAATATQRGANERDRHLHHLLPL